MILTLRTDNPLAEVGVYQDDKSQIVYEKWEAHRQLAETLHQRIQKILESNSIEWADIRGVVVYHGPGSFTGLRIGVSVANAIGYSFGIPVAGTSGDEWIQEGIEKLLNGEAEGTVIPFYGSDANITTPRK